MAKDKETPMCKLTRENVSLGSPAVRIEIQFWIRDQARPSQSVGLKEDSCIVRFVDQNLVQISSLSFQESERDEVSTSARQDLPSRETTEPGRSENSLEANSHCKDYKALGYEETTYPESVWE